MLFSKQTFKFSSQSSWLTRATSLSLSVLMLSANLPSLALAADPNLLTGDVRVTVSPANLRETLPIAGASRKVTMALHGISIQDALRALAKQGGFNVLIDASVQGNISVDLNNVSIQDALDTFKTYGNLAYSVQGNSLMVADATSAKGTAYNKSVSRIIPLHNANAKVVADLLNKTVFADRVATAATTGGGTPALPVVPDFHTNSLVVVGSPVDIKTVLEHVEALDKPRQSKTWRLSQANALDVATILSASLFNEGRPVITTTGGSTSAATSSTDGTPSNPTSMRVTADNISEGTGTSQSSQSGGNASSGSSTGQASLINNMTLRGRVKETQTIQVSPSGPIIIPDTRLNAVTLMGTAEQIAMAEALIPTLDRKVPQVVLEASLVEVSEGGRKELSLNVGGNSGYISGGSNNSPSASRLVNRAFSNLVGQATNATTPLENILQFSSSPLHRATDLVVQLNALVSKNKAKVLANPTVVTTSDNETIISIVDEIIRSVSITQGFGLPPTATDNLGEAGIVLNILPKVGADGSISLRVRPVISTVADTRTDRSGNVVTLLSKREVLAQNAVLHDGETFVLGGLIHNTNSQAIARNPLLSNLPIVGALARNTTTSGSKTELVVMITPHIINDNPPLAQRQARLTDPNTTDPNFIPVSLNNLKQNKLPAALPPLDQVHVIGNTSSAQEPYRATSNEARPAADIWNSVKPHTQSQWPSGAPQATSAWSQNTSPVATDGKISDETIRAIMNKFK